MAIVALTAATALAGCGSSQTPTNSNANVGPDLTDLDLDTAVITYFSNEGSLPPPTRSYFVTIDARGAVVDADPTISPGQALLAVPPGAMEDMLERIAALGALQPSELTDCVGGPGVGVTVRANESSDPIVSHIVFPCTDEENVWEEQITASVEPVVGAFDPARFFTG